ncbi:MAG: hypothetical protein LH632_10510 [Rhodoferax sp.]|nr:hypothetical protein [Rhodoferax sp.]
MEKTHAGTQSVEVGFGLLDVPKRAADQTMVRELAFAAGMCVAPAPRYIFIFHRLSLAFRHSDTTRFRVDCRKSAAPAVAG